MDVRSIQASTISFDRYAASGKLSAQNLSKLCSTGSYAEFLWNRAFQYCRKLCIYGASRLLYSSMLTPSNQGEVQSTLSQMNAVKGYILFYNFHIPVPQNLRNSCKWNTVFDHLLSQTPSE